MELPVLTIDQLRNAVQGDRIDTVLLAVTDMQGRLQGKRLTARHFLDGVLAHGAEAFDDFEMVPDLDTLRPVPWHEGTVLCLADLRWAGGEPVIASPRRILRRQLERLSERGLEAFAGTALEFIVFQGTYEEAFEKGYRDLRPATVDSSLLGTSRIGPLLRRIRKQMGAAGMVVESSGPHGVTFRTGPALRIADEHSIYKTGAKEIAAQEAMAITFMASYDEREASSCHIQMSIRDLDDAGFDRVVAGQRACLRELTLMYAPTINSYKRLAAAPAAVTWVVGHRESRRFELRLAGSDVNPYLALAAMIASALHGLDREYEGADKPHVPRTLSEARELFAASPVAREAFGDDLVEHCVDNARVELEAFESFVTDWERARGFERL
jgi:glutamine synthetase